MTKLDAIDLMLLELERAEVLHPRWPLDPIHAAGVVVEEAGKLLAACHDQLYSEWDCSSEIQDEAVQTGAMAIRFLMNEWAWRTGVSSHSDEISYVKALFGRKVEDNGGQG